MTQQVTTSRDDVVVHATYASRLDGSDQPYLLWISGKRNSGRALPMVFLLHDLLPDPSRSNWLEEAYRILARWRPVLASGPPVAFAILFGRGNSGWFGAGATDWIEAWGDIAASYGVDRRRSTLIGIGAGGTGALRLAGWYPDRVAAVAAIGPAPSKPPFANHRQSCSNIVAALDPLHLVDHLIRMPIFIEHPCWHWGQKGTASPAWTRTLAENLAGRGGVVERIRPEPGLRLEGELPSEPAQVWNWLRPHWESLSDVPATRPHSVLAPWMRSADGVEVLSMLVPDRPARFHRRRNEVETENIRRLLLHFEDRGELELDGGLQPIAEPGWWAFERIGPTWVMGASCPCPEFPPRPLGHPIDLWFAPTCLVHGTRGSDVASRVLRDQAEELAARLAGGLEGAGLDLPIEIQSDEAVLEKLPTGNRVILGVPKVNLYLAARAFEFPFGAVPPHPADSLFASIYQAEPEGTTLILAGRGLAAQARMGSLPTPYLPQILQLQRGRKIGI